MELFGFSEDGTIDQPQLRRNPFCMLKPEAPNSHLKEVIELAERKTPRAARGVPNIFIDKWKPGIIVAAWLPVLARALPAFVLWSSAARLWKRP